MMEPWPDWSEEEWKRRLVAVQKFNPYHEPAGSPVGGRFASRTGAGVSVPAGQRWDTHPVVETFDNPTDPGYGEERFTGHDTPRTEEEQKLQHLLKESLAAVPESFGLHDASITTTFYSLSENGKIPPFVAAYEAHTGGDEGRFLLSDTATTDHLKNMEKLATVVPPEFQHHMMPPDSPGENIKSVMLHETGHLVDHLIGQTELRKYLARTNDPDISPDAMKGVMFTASNMKMESMLEAAVRYDLGMGQAAQRPFPSVYHATLQAAPETFADVFAYAAGAKRIRGLKAAIFKQTFPLTVHVAGKILTKYGVKGRSTVLSKAELDEAMARGFDPLFLEHIFEKRGEWNFAPAPYCHEGRMSLTDGSVAVFTSERTASGQYRDGLRIEAGTTKRYNPDQPRDPKGEPTGGQWTSGTGGEGGVAVPGGEALHPYHSPPTPEKSLSSAQEDTIKALLAQDIPTRRQIEAADPALMNLWADATHTIPLRAKELVPDFADWSQEDKHIATALQERTARWEQDGVIPDDMGERIERAGNQLYADLLASGANGKQALELTQRAVDMLAAQEAESVGRTLGDHGVRHLLTDAVMAEDILRVIPGYRVSPKTRALLVLAGAFHDTGYLTPPARNFLDQQHPQWGEDYARQSGVLSLVSAALGKGSGEHLATIIRTHSETGMDWAEKPMTSAFRLADNLALFHAEKMPALVRYAPKNREVLERLGRGEITPAQAQHDAMAHIAASVAHPRIKARMAEAAKEISPILPKLTLGMLGGRYQGAKWRGDGVEITLHRTSDKSSFMHRVSDMGYRQFKKFAETYLGDQAAERVFKDTAWVFEDKVTHAKLYTTMVGTVVGKLFDALWRV